MSEITARINEVLLSSMFKTKEESEEYIASGGELVISEGITATFGFHPDRLKENKEKIKALVIELVLSAFLRPSGGLGNSFLYLVFKEDETTWGEHTDAEALLVLAQALGWAGYCLPRPMWKVFPGGLPYVWFNDLKVTEEPQGENDNSKLKAAAVLLEEVKNGSDNPMKTISEKYQQLKKDIN